MSICINFVFVKGPVTMNRDERLLNRSRYRPSVIQVDFSRIEFQALSKLSRAGNQPSP